MKSRISFVLAASSLLTFTAACSPPSAQDSAQIREKSDLWESAFNSGDVDSVVALYSTDSRLLPENAPMAQGLEAVGGAFGDMVAAGLTGSLTTVEAKAAGNLGYHIGTYELSAGGALADRGKFLEIWQKVDGDWKITADMFSSDLPDGAPQGQLLMATHRVADAERWLAAWRGENSRRGLFEANGAASVKTFQSMNDPDLTGLLIDVTDMEALQSMLESEEGSAAKEADGVIEATISLLGEVPED